MSTSIQFEGDGFIQCPECKKFAKFMEFNQESRVEVYRCDEGHVTEVPEVK